MKKSVLIGIIGIIVIAVIFLVVVITTAFYSEPTEHYTEGLEFTLNDDGKSYTVTGIGTCIEEYIIIPSRYQGKPVTGIGYCAFAYNDSLKSVTIPTSVTRIESFAFANSFELTRINYKGTLEQWSAIDRGSFMFNNVKSYLIYCTDGTTYY